MITVLLTERSGYESDILEARWSWLKDLLIYLGIDVEVLDNAEIPVLVEYLIDEEVEITEYPSIGAMKVSLNGEVVGEWAGPEMTLKNEDGKLYFEVEIEHWSILDEEIEQFGD